MTVDTRARRLGQFVDVVLMMAALALGVVAAGAVALLRYDVNLPQDGSERPSDGLWLLLLVAAPPIALSLTNRRLRLSLGRRLAATALRKRAPPTRGDRSRAATRAGAGT